MDVVDREQLAAVEEASPWLVVRACAGSGKSTTLAHRCKRLIDVAGVHPQGILVLTFSVASRDDLTAKFAQMGGAMPQVLTHHAFALSLLRQLPGPHEKDQIVEASEQRKILRECLGTPNGRESAVGKQAFRRMLTAIAKAKVKPGPSIQTQHHPILMQPHASPCIPIRPQACGHSDSTIEFAKVFSTYEAELRRRRLIDFEDMITLALDTVRSAGVAFQPRHTHVLVDETQDMSDAQFALLKCIAPIGRVALTVFGDSDQTIYGFRGSRPDMLARITTHWKATELTLPTNYRCGPHIVTAAKSVVALSGGATSLEMRPSSNDSSLVRLVPCTDRQHELLTIARELLTRPPSGPMAGGSVAILCRVRAECAEVRKALKEFGVAVAAADKASSRDGGAVEVLSFLKLVANPTDDASFLSALAISGQGGAAFGPTGAVSSYLAAITSSAPRSTPWLLSAAQQACRSGYTAVQSFSGDLKLTRPQQQVISDMLSLLTEMRKQAVSPRPLHCVPMLESLASRVKVTANLTLEDVAHLPPPLDRSVLTPW